MPRDKLRRDLNETAWDIVQAATGEGERPQPPGKGEPHPDAVERGRIGGRKGGRVRAEKLSRAQRKQIARKAAKRRWAKS